ncbi:MAG: prephenate dehydratase [Rickettsiales bacterium]|nr:prephenate dehydratase [Rickettsiales bacterium]
MVSDNIIAFQGVFGANSDLACRKAFPYMQTLPCENFEDAFKAVEEGKAKYCMIPVGNSYAGRVAEIHNLIPKTSLSIIGEYFEKIEHQLLAVKGTKIEDIKEVYSHPQALMQCNNNIAKYGFKPIRHSNTAFAAKEISEKKDKTKAALASSLAAELYGLDILQKNFEDDSNNTTLFLVFSKEPIDPDPEKEKYIITSMMFTTRNIPAGLYKALGGFATNNVNIIKLESYIPEVESSQAQFFISFEGSPREKNVQRAIEELGFFTKKTKLLGVYPAHKSRRVEN